jgi:hypothetical protein
MKARISWVITGLCLALLSLAWFSPTQVDEDLRFPSQGINPPGAPSDATRSSTTGLLEFSGSADNVIAGSFQMPHAWAAGTSIVPHLHLILANSAAGAVSRWRFDYAIVNINGVLAADYGAAMYTTGTAVSCTAADPATPRKHIILSLGTISMSGITESAIVLWKITRLAASDGADNDTGAIVLTDFDVHYKVEKLGKNI